MHSPLTLNAHTDAKLTQGRVDLDSIQATSLLIQAGTNIRGHANRFLATFGSVNTFKYSFYP